jgi:hypothetical protein
MNSDPHRKKRTRRRLVGLGLLFSLFCVSFQIRNASAQVSVTGRFGLWENFEGRSADGNFVCGMASHGDSKSFMIKHFENRDFFVVHVYNPGWRVSRPRDVEVALRFGTQFNSGRLFGEAHPPRNSSSALVEVHIPYEGSGAFWNGFRLASMGYLDFLTGNEGTWRINLAGSNAATQHFMRCVDRRGFATQPFSTIPPDRSEKEISPSSLSSGGGRKSPF